jgi:hypothetical protein
MLGQEPCSFPAASCGTALVHLPKIDLVRKNGPGGPLNARGIRRVAPTASTATRKRGRPRPSFGEEGDPAIAALGPAGLGRDGGRVDRAPTGDGLTVYRADAAPLRVRRRIVHRAGVRVSKDLYRVVHGGGQSESADRQ